MISAHPTGTKPRPTPPRALQALSVALGLVFAVLVFQDLAARGPTGRAPAWLVLRFGAVAAILAAGYVAAPLLAGRGPWRSFAAGLLLAPSVLGWLLMFWPGLLSTPFLGLLGTVSGGVLVALYAYALRDLASEFLGGRTDGRPPACVGSKSS